MEIDKKGIKGLACRAFDLWVNLEASRCKPDSNYHQVVEFLKQRFRAEELNPLLLTLGLLEMALIEDALKNRPYLSQEERDKVIQDVVESLAEAFPEIVSEMEKLVDQLQERLTQFKQLAHKYRAGGE
jgi:hypothetical protein